MRKAVALISGGLDSMLAAKVMIKQNIHVEGLNFYTGFCHSGHTSSIRKNNKTKPKRNDALWVAEQLGIKLHIIVKLGGFPRPDLANAMPRSEVDTRAVESQPKTLSLVVASI